MNRNIAMHYIVGVSIGSMMEPTSIAIIEQETRVRDGWDAYNHALRLRHLERVPLDMRYPDLVDHVGGYCQRKVAAPTNPDRPWFHAVI